MMLKFFLSACVVFTASISAYAIDVSPELQKLQGNWEVIELVEDGKVIPKEAFKVWLPSGGKLEIADNAIIFTSPQDQKKTVKIFSVSPTQYPKTIDITSKDGTDGWGIYRFDQDRLVICFTHPNDAARPTEFSSDKDSKRMLMVLHKASKQTTIPQKAASTPPETPQPAATGKVISDAQVAELLKGTWKYHDSLGALIVTFTPSGNFSTIREVQELQLFHKVFVQTPVSNGRWQVQNGQLKFFIAASNDINKVNKEFGFTIRSISTADFIFVDYLGRVGKATKVH